MIDGSPYPAYKDSGVSYVGKVPAHWEITRAKYLFQEADERSATGEEELLSVSHITGVTPRSQKNITMFLAESTVGYKVCRPNDIVVNTMWAWMAALGIARQVGAVSPSYGVYRPLDNNGALPDYVDHLLRTQPYASEYLVASTGINSSRLRLYPEQFLSIRILRPPLDEQELILRFLDHADRRIRRYIRAKKKLIALLNEQKQAMIHRALTRGLDPRVHFKPSGVAWLGDVPEHWEVARLGRLVHLTTGFAFKSVGFSQSESDIRLLRGVNVAPGRIRWNSVVRWPITDIHGFADFEMRPGDIALGMDRPIVGGGVRVAEIKADDVPSLLLQRVARIRPRQELDQRFALLALGGKSFSDYLTPIFTGISVPHVSPDQIGAFRLALPPKAEQVTIVAFLKNATADIDGTINRTENELSLFHEYRRRLVDDLVTGKLDVRKAAALPQEPDEEPESLDEPSEATDAGEEALDGVPEETEA